MENDPPSLSLGGKGPKKPKEPNPRNDQRRERERAAREGGQQHVQPPVQQPPMSAIPAFPNSRLTSDWSLRQGVIDHVFDQNEELICASVCLCRLLQAHYNKDKVTALQHRFSITDLTNFVKKKTNKLVISNLNIALDYIVNRGLLKEGASSKGFRVEGRFERQRAYTRDQVYALVDQIPLAICLEDTLDLKNLLKEEIYNVPVLRVGEVLDDAPDHALLVVAKGVVTLTGQEFLVVQNSWGDKWCNGGYGRISLEPGGTFQVFWPTESCKKSSRPTDQALLSDQRV